MSLKVPNQTLLKALLSCNVEFDAAGNVFFDFRSGDPIFEALTEQALEAGNHRFTDAEGRLCVRVADLI